jgi:hypothetical protein
MYVLMQSSRISQQYLDALYHQIGVCDESGNFWGDKVFGPKDKFTDEEELIGTSFFGRHRGDQTYIWKDLMQFLMKLPPTSGLSILVTEISLGCDLYDPVREAEIAGVFDHHPGTIIYGHDYSSYFTQIAHQGYYPLEKTVHVYDWHKYFEDTNIDGYVKIQPNLKSRTRILAPSDIRNLKGTFDITVSNIMNPAPLGLKDAIKARSRHLAIRGSLLATRSKVAGISREYNDYFDPEEGGFKMLDPRPELLGFSASIQIPELYDPTKHAHPPPLPQGTKNPATKGGAGFDIELG